VSCAETKDPSKNLLKIERFEKVFYESDTGSIDQIKEIYPFFFPSNFSDEIWVRRLNDPIQREIYNEILYQYDDISSLQIQITKFFQNTDKYFDSILKPRLITVNTDVDYRNRIILADSILLIGLDNYLGFDHRFYEGIPNYIKEDLNQQNIISDIASQYAKKLIPSLDDYTFLDKIIYHGKVLYYKDIILDEVPDNYKIGYSQKKINWAIENEYFVWTYFIENEILFDPDNKLNSRFINNAPFSKFYLENDKDSSEMIGKFIGWQIVKSFMKNNKISFKEMIALKPIDIYNKSKYKPKK
jgi:hypothetical protein